MCKKLQILITVAAVAASTASVALAAPKTESGTATVYLADYDSDGKLIGLSVYDHYTYTTDDAVREYVGGLKPSQKAFVWNENQEPVTSAIQAVEERYGDNDFSDGWDF